MPVDTLVFDRSEHAAIAITGIWAYSSGFAFTVTRLIRPDAPGWDGGIMPGAPEGWRGVDRALEITLQLGDGSRIVSDGPRGDAEPTGPILRFNGGHGTTHFQLTRWWAWPLPPTGPVEFICHWPTFGIGETRVAVSAQLILDAASRSVRLWPEGQS